MPNNYFRFKQFTVRQENAAMKVNTDGVLLGAWMDVQDLTHDTVRILDIGTGTGVIALMLAQRVPQAAIDAVEIDEASAQQAAENVRHSPWPERVNVVNTDFQAYAAESGKQYDVIVSNPPYFVDALLPGDRQRMQARHATALPYDELLNGVVKLLAAGGCFGVILPYVEGSVFIAKAAAAGLYCTRKTNVGAAVGRPVKRLLLTFERTKRVLHEQHFCIHPADSAEYTAEYQELTKEFYLNF